MKNLNSLNQFRDGYFNKFVIDTKNNGMFLFPRKGKFGFYQVIASEGLGWEHVSVCLLDNYYEELERIPTWDEMCEIKEIFFEKDETVVEFHPKEEDYIDENPWVLHMWKCSDQKFPVPGKESDENAIVQNLTFPRANGAYNVIVTESTKWKRVKVSLTDANGNPIKRYPRWNDMCEVKDKLFLPEEAAFQLHSDESSEDDYTLEILKPLKEDFPQPLPILVGTKRKVKKRP